MTALRKSEEKSANPMVDTWTPAATVRRAFRAGPKRKTDLEYDLESAILHARILLIEFRAAMLKAKITTTGEDVRAALVLMTPETAESNQVHLLSMPRQLEDLPELSTKAARLEKAYNVVPLGVAIWQRDRKAGASTTWIHPWLVDQRAQRAANAAQKAFVASEGKETKVTF